jgi:DNA polymerase-4
MPMAQARRLCPHTVVPPVRTGHYAAVSRQIRAIFDAFTPLVEPLRLDEAFLDLHGCEGLFGQSRLKAFRPRRSETALVLR